MVKVGNLKLNGYKAHLHSTFLNVSHFIRSFSSITQEGPINYGNLMYDRRVVRGNTYAMQLLSWKQHEAHKKMLQRKQEKKENEVHAPEMKDVADRSDVQTELYLEEILDHIIEVDMECQTDAFIKRLPSPAFIPQKTGVDVATQIEEGELFDFDIEVKPMLEVLVGKTLEQALLEVMEEEDLRNLWVQQYEYQELRNAELAEVQRLEENERRHSEEKVRRMAMQYEIQTKAEVVSKKVAAHAFSIRYLADLIPSVFISLRNKGFFYDEIQSGKLLGFKDECGINKHLLYTKGLS
uniref:Radial spoke head 3 n=1 Tax=Naja naja TaxID=35670 RepID=A0A8C6Y2W1_NAJNA